MKKILTIWIISIAILVALPALAGDSIIDRMISGVRDSKIDLPEGNPENPELIVAGVIRTALGFIGAVFMILIIVAGFMWMTARGNEEKITKARNIIISAAAGLLIILLAYLITYRVIFVLRSAATAGTGG